LSNWQGALLTTAGVLLLIAGGWYVVSRRGHARTKAILALLLGVLLLLAGFVLADASAARATVAIVFAILSVGAARVALQRSPRAMLRNARMHVAAPRATHPVLIINPKSGGGKAEKFDLVTACRERGIEAVELHLGDDLVELAEHAVARGADAIGMAGGDGSQALVASVAARHDIPHVVVPAGTRNHFALDLGIDRDDVVGALDAFQDGVEHRVDLAKVNGRVFVNNASLGVYAKIVQSPDYRDAKRKTTAEMLPDLLGPDATPMDLRFTDQNGKEHATALIIMVSNNPYELHRLAGGGTRARVDLGVLGIVAAQIANAGEFARFIALEAAGQPQRFSGWIEWTAPHFRVDSAAPVEIGLDGEAMTLDPPLLFQIDPLALRIRVPRLAIGRSPAAKTVHVLSGTTIAELCAVASGRRAMSS
jgi:diacylglycerol kinase family enzyme